MRRFCIIAAVAAAVLSGCGSGKSTAKEPLTRDFATIKAPAMMTDYLEIMTYVGANFWNNVFADTTRGYLCDSLHIAGIESIAFEEQIGMFSTIMGMIAVEDARQDVAILFDKVSEAQLREPESNVFERTNELINKYLYDPNSPVRYEDLYGVWASRLSESPLVSAGMRQAYAMDAKMCALNAVGTKAADFEFVDLKGRRHSLYSVKAPLTLLFFSNPGCEACAEIIRAINGNSMITEMIGSGELAVVNVYIDEEIARWKECAADYPDAWLNGYDPSFSIRTDITYNVRAIPSLYLLAGDKTVLMKDAPPENVFERLESLASGRDR